MSGATKMLTPGGGGVIVTPASSIASDVTVNIPTVNVNNGTLVCSNSSGNVGIGVTSPVTKLDVSNSIALGASGYTPKTTASTTAQFAYGTIGIEQNGQMQILNNAYNSGSNQYKYIVSGLGVSAYELAWGVHSWYTASPGTADAAVTWTERMRINANGNVLVGTTVETTGYKFKVAGNIDLAGDLKLSSYSSTLEGSEIDFTPGASYVGYEKSLDMYAADMRLFGGNNWNFQIFSTAGTANLSVQGAVSKGSGSFRIGHPIPELTETTDLVHSFIEGPQADNLYRGQVQLVNGTAQVNLDTASRMTEGTFVLLNRRVQCFTTNESTWDAVRGSITGNILTIECQNADSGATVSWLVIGERQDKHMYDTDWTDDEGRVITEPPKRDYGPVKNKAEVTE